MRISFLQPSNRRKAIKRFTKKGVTSYPPVKNFTSHSYDIPISQEGLAKKEALCKQHARNGACMLKGFLTEDLRNESRAGKVDRNALTENLILDIDGVPLPYLQFEPPLNRMQLQNCAEAIIANLPEEFHDVSYIAHASSSMGVKPNRVCLHLDFALATPVSPQTLKEYVVYLNHSIKMFEQAFTLSASGTALRFPLDRSVVDNSHLIYIGNPQFQAPLQDPIPDPEDRIFLQQKEKATVDIQPLLEADANAQHNTKLNTKRINILRESMGLPKHKTHTAPVTIDGNTLHIITNPESSKLSFVSEEGEYVRYNVNGGDSAAYYVKRLNPSIVYNFKGEPPFLFEVADSETYYWHLETFLGKGATEDNEGSSPDSTTLIPLIFRDEQSNQYYNALIDSHTAKISKIAKSDRAALPDWMAQYGGAMPQHVPIWEYIFNPHLSSAIDFKGRIINKYIPSELMAGDLSEDFPKLNYQTAMAISEDCPNITRFLIHVLGNDTDLFYHFINWLAAALQTKDKLGTAWIFQGTQGTGKGIFFDHILSPLVGTGIDPTQTYATKVRIENIEDQFNSWQESSLFVVFDEFRLSDTHSSRRLFNKIKGLITESFQPIRGIRENMRITQSYTNYFFFSNDQDVIYMPEGDRRFNVAPRQEQRLKEVFPDEGHLVNTLIPEELPMFAAHMRHFDIDLNRARTVEENAAKQAIREVSRTTIEDFTEAVKLGDLEFFLPILDMPYQAPGAGYVLPAQAIMKSILKDYGEDTSKLTIDELRIIYCAFIGPSDNSRKFGKLMARHGLMGKRIKRGGRVHRGYAISWSLSENDIDVLRETYLTPIDNSFGSNITPFPGGAA